MLSKVCKFRVTNRLKNQKTNMTISAPQRFVKELANYLVGNQAHMSILLEMNNPLAQQWAKLRNATPVFGWVTVEEAEKILTSFLFGEE